VNELQKLLDFEITDVRIEKLEQRVDLVQDALRRSDSSNAVSSTQLKTLQQLGKIQEIK
jgi:hypothetical protein